MFSECEDEARRTYYEVQTIRADEDRDGRHVILDDFKTFASREVEHPLMAETEIMLSPRMLTR